MPINIIYMKLLKIELRTSHTGLDNTTIQVNEERYENIMAMSISTGAFEVKVIHGTEEMKKLNPNARQTPPKVGLAFIAKARDIHHHAIRKSPIKRVPEEQTKLEFNDQD